LSVSTVQQVVYPFFVCTRPGRLIAEVRHTYFQLPVTCRTDRITQAMLLKRRVEGEYSTY